MVFFNLFQNPRCPTTSYNLYDLLISPNHCRFISHGTSQKRFPELVQVHPLSASPTKWVRKKQTEARPCFSFSASKQYIAFSCVFLTISFCATGHRFWRCCDAVSSGSLPLRNHWCWGGKWAATMPWFAGEVLVKCVWEYPTCKLSRRNQSVYIQDGVLNTDPSPKKGIKKSSP